jgi:hypothetical protein
MATHAYAFGHAIHTYDIALAKPTQAIPGTAQLINVPVADYSISSKHKKTGFQN